jgi:hypothetical protein
VRKRITAAMQCQGKKWHERCPIFIQPHLFFCNYMGIAHCGRLLAALVLGSLLPGLAKSILNLVQYLAAPDEEYAFYLLDGATMLSMLLGICWLNRTGRVRAASFCFLALLTLVVTGLDPLDTLGRVLLVYTVPIVVAHFLVQPVHSFLFALLAAVGYIVACFTGEPILSSYSTCLCKIPVLPHFFSCSLELGDENF